MENIDNERIITAVQKVQALYDKICGIKWWNSPYIGLSTKIGCIQNLRLLLFTFSFIKINSLSFVMASILEPAHKSYDGARIKNTLQICTRSPVYTDERYCANAVCLVRMYRNCASPPNIRVRLVSPVRHTRQFISYSEPTCILTERSSAYAVERIHSYRKLVLWQP